LSDDETEEEGSPCLPPASEREPVRYVGELDASGSRHGLGGAHFADGSTYYGLWAAGSMQGEGEHRGIDHSVYRGQFDRGRFHGDGVLETVTASRYTGKWNEGTKHGKGKFEYQDGSWYEGEWVEGERHGLGVLVGADGSRLEGLWVDDSVEGEALWLHEAFRLDGEWMAREEEDEADAQVSLQYTASLLQRWRAEHKLVSFGGTSDAHRPSAQGDQWTAYFSRKDSKYDSTAERIDRKLTSLLAEGLTPEEEGVAVGNHLIGVLEGGIHPCGFLTNQFCRIFHQAYEPKQEIPFPGAAVSLPLAIGDLRGFLVSMRSYMFSHMAKCLDTKQRQRHAHSVLVDVVFPMVFPPIWSLYCEAWAVKDEAIAEVGKTFLAVTVSECMDRLCLKKSLRLDSLASIDRANVNPAEAAAAPPIESEAIESEAGGASSEELTLTLIGASSEERMSSSDPLWVNTCKGEPGEEGEDGEDGVSMAGSLDGVLLPPPSPVTRPSTCSTRVGGDLRAVGDLRGTPYAEAIAILRRLPDHASPTAKIECLKACSRSILACIEAFPRGPDPKQITLGAEDKFPVVLFVVIQANVPHIASECALMSDALDERTRQVSEAGYRVTELQAAVDHLQGLAPPPSFHPAPAGEVGNTHQKHEAAAELASPSSIVLNLGGAARVRGKSKAQAGGEEA